MYHLRVPQTEEELERYYQFRCIFAFCFDSTRRKIG
ncbi:hypothetical protein, partial [Salmonella enterica]